MQNQNNSSLVNSIPHVIVASMIEQNIRERAQKRSIAESAKRDAHSYEPSKALN